MELQIRNNTFLLLPQKAIFWKEQNTILISDLHIGKISHFRKAGIAIPKEAVQKNFTRLDEIIHDNEPEAVVFIGDLFHSDVNQEWDQFCTWRKQYADIRMDIVVGNHDKLPVDFCDQYQITVYPKDLTIGPFTFTHHPRDKFKNGEYIVSGHVHPVISLNGKARQSMSTPCFYFGSQQAILPSFGYFTGGYSIEVGETDSVVAILNNKLFSVQLNSDHI
jgi:DNA ligase-associated metallophosphoesterase